MYLFIYSKLLLKTDIQHWIRQISDSNRPLRLSCTKNRVNFPSQHLLRATSQVMTIATDVAFCFFLSFFFWDSWEVETSRTSPRVASPCSCLPAVREGSAVNKRHQRWGGKFTASRPLWCRTLYSVCKKYL